MWDRDTDVPLRLWGDGQFVAGSVADAAIAESIARQFLASHIATLAPGASASDFELVSNQLGGSGDVRSIGFIQRANGVRVLGGAIGFAFKRDRLAMVSSTALPDVAVSIPSNRLGSLAIQRAATRWLATDGHTVAARTVASALGGERVIIPIVRPRVGASTSITYRVAEQVAVEATTGVGRWNVWIDAADASPIARKSTIMYATGRVTFDVPERRPGGARAAFPAANATFLVNGANTTAALDGTVTWAGTAPATAVLAARGRFASVANQAGANLTEQVTLQPGGVFSWSKAATEFDDAQLNAYIHADVAKRFAKTRLNPNLAWLDQVIPVFVNENDTCNAFSTGDDIHFFRRSTQCENTGRLADVVYHEFGHSLHGNSIIEGVGGFDGSLSEGISDTLAMAITGDPGMGRGFFHSDEPLRNLEPIGSEKRFPEDATGEVHNDGEIIGGALWDLRVALEAKLGATAGFDKWLVIMYAMFQRASDLQTTFAEALLADDDDGNVSNGTPNQCEITAAFGAHGLADPSLTLGISTPVRDNFTVSVVAAPPASACPGSTVASAMLEWKPRGASGGGQVPLTQTGDTYTGDIPAQPDGTVVQYKVTMSLSDGSTISFPQNNADPFYEFYVGQVTTLWCASFDDAASAGAADWTKTPDWEAGPPLGLATDPKVAFAGTNVFGMDLTQDGAYRPGNMSVAETPEIDLQGHTAVRLQYQRWLGVEDGFYDNARIFANGTQVYTNFASANDPQTGGVNHVDREWRFQDVDLSAVAAASTTGKVKLSFILESDEGLEFGGWTLDDVCVVAISGLALTCGNSQDDEGETCDDGNRVDGDGCSANCQDEAGEGGGCCSAGGGPEGPIALSLLTLGLVVWRRRRN
jgi:cysteine-rich repeat protein